MTGRVVKDAGKGIRTGSADRIVCGLRRHQWRRHFVAWSESN